MVIVHVSISQVVQVLLEELSKLVVANNAFGPLHFHFCVCWGAAAGVGGWLELKRRATRDTVWSRCKTEKGTLSTYIDKATCLVGGSNQ